jgi:putative addiction module component (TIGR02574 family)
MPSTMQSLGIDRLPRTERLALVQEIWDTIAAEQSPPLLVGEAQRQELERRVAEDEAAPDDVIPWEQVKAQALARLAKP